MKIPFIRNIILLCMTIAAGCDPVVVDVKIPEGSARMTINTYFIADSSWRIGVTRARHVLDARSGFEDISNATVTILEDGQFLTTLTYIPPETRWSEEYGVYASDNAAAILPKPGKTYEVRVHTDEYGDASAFCKMPLSVPVAEVIVHSWDFDGNSRIPLTVHFNDPPGEENFYELYVKRTVFRNRVTNNITSITQAETSVETLDPLFYQQSETFDFLDPSGKPFPVLFSDAGLDGKLLKISCKAYVYPPSSNPNQKESYEIVVRALSKEYYLYAVTRNLQQAAERDPFAQPVKIYSNVQNGFGIFGGYSQSAMAFE